MGESFPQLLASNTQTHVKTLNPSAKRSESHHSGSDETWVLSPQALGDVMNRDTQTALLGAPLTSFLCTQELA